MTGGGACAGFTGAATRGGVGGGGIALGGGVLGTAGARREYLFAASKYLAASLGCPSSA